MVVLFRLRLRLRLRPPDQLRLRVWQHFTLARSKDETMKLKENDQGVLTLAEKFQVAIFNKYANVDSES